MLMLKAFKDLTIGYILSFLSVIIIGYLLYTFLIPNLAFLVAFILIWAIFWTTFLNGKAVKRINKISAEAMQTCIFSPLITVYESLRTKNHGNRIPIDLSLASAYQIRGQLDMAQKTLDSVPRSFKSNRQGIMTALSYFNILSFCHILRGELDEAEEALQIMGRYMANPMVASISGQWNALHQGKTILVSVLRKDPEVNETEIIELMDQQTSPTRILLFRYILCNYYLCSGDTEKAISHLNAMIESGGDTFYVSWAREQLNQIA